MRVYIATSQDGFIATSDGQVDWLYELPHPRGGIDFDEFMEGVDYVLMGRKTYESGLRECEKHSIDWRYRKPVYVLTHRPVTEAPGVAIQGTPEEILERLGAAIPLLDAEQLASFALESDEPLTDGWRQRIYIRPGRD